MLATDRAPTGEADEKSFPLEHPDSLADRVARHPEVVGEPVFGEAVAGRVVAIDDPATQLGHDLVAQRQMTITDRHRASHRWSSLSRAHRFRVSVSGGG